MARRFLRVPTSLPIVLALVLVAAPARAQRAPAVPPAPLRSTADEEPGLAVSPALMAPPATSAAPASPVPTTRPSLRVARGGPDIKAPPAPSGLPVLAWRPEWGRVGGSDYALIVTGASVAVAAAVLKPQPRHFYGGVLFDESVRDAVGLRSVQDRYTARDMSDVTLTLLLTSPFFVDALVTAWWYRGSADVAREMAIIDAETLAVVGAIQGVTNGLASRERPYGRECGTELRGDLSDCTGNVRYRSFFSGHAAFSFASAGLVCSHHLRLGLLGGNADTWACVAAAFAAGATASLRVFGDMHYASDILTGALVGTAAGLGIPALHYAKRRPAGTATPGLEVTVVPMSLGAGLVGAF